MGNVVTCLLRCYLLVIGDGLYTGESMGASNDL